MANYQDLTGRRFGRITVIGDAGRNQWRAVKWLCRCSCGQQTMVAAGSLRSGRTTSCGCRNREVAAKRIGVRSWKHGYSKLPIAAVWKAMIDRCYNTKNDNYRNYGGRGIRVCESLRTSPFHLLELLGARPDKCSLDRINNDGMYCCGSCAECVRLGLVLNVRWATHRQQNSNRRNNRWFTWVGKTQHLSDWCKELNISPTTVYRRLRCGQHPLERLRAPRKSKCEVPS